MPNDIWELFVEHFEFTLGTFLLGFITMWINRGIQKYKLSIEEVELLSTFKEIVTKKDPNQRLLLAQYYAKLAPTFWGRRRWGKYSEIIYENEIKVALNKVEELKPIKDNLSKEINDARKKGDKRLDLEIELLKVEMEQEKLKQRFSPLYGSDSLVSEARSFELDEGGIESLPIGQFRIEKLVADQAGGSKVDLEYISKSGVSSKFSLKAPARRLIGTDEEIIFVGTENKEDGSTIGQFTVYFPYSATASE